MSNYIFDFDGTIVDSLEHVVEVFNMISKRRTPFTAVQIEAFRHMSSRQAIRAAGIPLWRIPTLMRNGKRSFQARIPKMHPFADMAETLQELRNRGHHLFILTSNSQNNVEQFLAIHKFKRYFEAVCCEAKLFSKAKHIKNILINCNLNAADTWYVGDETRDIVAAHKAGIQAIAVTWGFNHTDILRAAGPDKLIQAPAELLDIR